MSAMVYTRAFLTKKQFERVVGVAEATNIGTEPWSAAAKLLDYPPEVFHNVLDMVHTISMTHELNSIFSEDGPGISWTEQVVYAVELMVMTGWRVNV